PSSASLLTPSLLGAPRSTLFPYTTLFRSDVGVAAGTQAATAFQLPVRRRQAGQAVNGLLQRHQPAPAHVVPQEAGEVAVGARVRDRKSTRLNSSHVKISYAVFCLKKKKTA